MSLLYNQIITMTENPFKIWDIVVVNPNNGTLGFRSGQVCVVSCTKPYYIWVDGANTASWDVKRFRLAGDLEKIQFSDTQMTYPNPDPQYTDIPSPTKKLTNSIMTMQYFHTAVNIRENDKKSSQIIEKELVPYAVRTALSRNDMRDTLVRELPKDVKTSDCEFLIKEIF